MNTPPSSESTDPDLATAGGRAGSAVDARCDRLVDELVAASPTLATFLGLPGDAGSFDDFGPDGLQRLLEVNRSARTDLIAAPVVGRDEQLSRDIALERLDVEIDRIESGWAHASLNVIASPLQVIRQIFDLMPTDAPDDVEALGRRMLAVPEALSGYRASLAMAAEQGQISAVRQIEKCAEQARTYAGTAATPGFFRSLVQGLPSAVSVGPAGWLTSGAQAAEAALSDFADFIERELGPAAPERDAVGRERYAVASREFLGATVDLDETYAWGWHEFLSIEADMARVAERIAPGQGIPGAAALLDADRRYHVQGSDALRDWMQGISDRAVTELGRTHFDIPEPLRRLDCRIAPPGGGVGAYYVNPSDDLSRPGTMWWSVEADRLDFTTWRETTTVYHEGVPGHHLQIGTAVVEKAGLNAFRRLLAVTSGHAEGWALYAERLVREVGYLDDDGDLLGMLDAQLFRAARVVVDIGMHLEAVIPQGAGFHEGERWTPELATEFMLTRTVTDPAHVRDEIDRYLGWAGQAPAYKVGERVWLQARQDARRACDFDARAFHRRALRLGNMGLDPLRAALASV